MRKDNITLIHGDCMEYMRTLPDNAFDLAVVDPPYGSANSEFSRGGGDSDNASRSTWNRLKGGRNKRYYTPPSKKTHTERESRHRTVQMRNRGQSDTDDAKPG